MKYKIFTQLTKSALPMLSLFALHGHKAYATDGKIQNKLTMPRYKQFEQTRIDMPQMFTVDSRFRVKEKPTTLWNLLDHFSFASIEQKQSLELVFRKFGASEEEIAAAFNQEIHTQDELLTALLNFSQLAQDYLARRKGERWETLPKDGVEQGDTDLLKAAKCLNLFSEIKPHFEHPDAICVLGARKAFMDERVEHVAKILQAGNTTRYLILAGGERKATPKKEIDGSPEYIAQIAQEFGIESDQVTERYLMRKAFNEQAEIYHELNLPLIVEFNARASHGKRPTTETNIIELCNWLREHPNVRRLYIVSNQFYVAYQEAIINTILAEQGMDVEVAVIGPEFTFDRNPTIKIQNIVGELGTQLWAKVLKLIVDLNLRTKNEDLIQRFNTLYAGMPIARTFVEGRLRAGHLENAVKPQQRPY